MTCRKTSYPTEDAAQRWAAFMARENGHPMRHYQCRRCNLWHLTSQVEGLERALPWKTRSPDVFVASSSGGGEWLVQPSPMGGWMARTPAGNWSNVFATKLEAKKWCEAASFLPPERWSAG